MNLLILGIKIAIRTIVALACAVVLFLSFGGICDSFRFRRIGSEMRSDLHVGDTTPVIEAALRNARLEFSFDEYANRYQAIMRSTANHIFSLGDVSVYVYVDASKHFTKFEERMSYTFL